MTDPEAIETVVVKADEIVTALEASQRGTRTVLRVTAPFSARMRARIHVEQPGDGDDDAQLLLSPHVLLDDDCPSLPTSDETAERLRSRSDEQYSVEHHRETHEAALEEWRSTIPDHVVDAVELPAAGGAVSVALLSAADRE
ncbi:hypothetical protein GOC74_08795 [Halomicrobium mukohataei]|uniref:DUF8009 domain-containing protein n=1 Tax=Halomicrobium mukohataei TaxID=57705 RepID=A0A847UC46_9EURY|nr:hypothetical protein [Halomicrobium mukohataei]NLV10026.1 hypothetical protein [Halomicrobium mukohataei]